MELIIYLKSEEDLAVLEPLLKRMHLHFERKNEEQNMEVPLAEQHEENPFQQFLLSAPIMTDEQYDTFVENRKSFNQWRAN